MSELDRAFDAASSSGSTSKVSGFLTEPLAREIIDGITGPRLRRGFAEALRWFPAINRAHLVMLTERGLMEPDVAGRLLSHIDDLEREGVDAFELDPEREDPWFNYEAELIRRAGPEAGRLHMARSRNDLKCTQDRMQTRRLAEDLLRRCVDLRRALLDGADRYKEAIMPGYTHMQHAQPITYGWYLLGVEAALARDSGRVEDALQRMDECPLGAGALAGTRFPIDRERTARLLDFARPQPHSLDAVASRDALLELLAAATQVSLTVGRMSQDLYLWATYEFGMLDFPDRVASTSSMMPQKKNLTVLENLKARPAALIGAMTTAIVALRGMPFGHSQEVSIETGRWAADAIDELIAMLPATRIVVECATPRTARMEHLAGANFATATTLADLLTARHGLPFREAHHITGHYVRLVMNGTDTETAIREAYASETGHELDDAEALLVDALSPAGVLDATTGCGPSRAETTALLGEARRHLVLAETAAVDRQDRRDHASRLLAVACKKLEVTASQGAEH